MNRKLFFLFGIHLCVHWGTEPYVALHVCMVFTCKLHLTWACAKVNCGQGGLGPGFQDRGLDS